ncbi:MAG: hypothetical protein V4543_08960 [Bacteroidota bacterium]
MKIPQKIAFDLFYCLFKVAFVNLKLPFPVPNANGRIEYFNSLATDIVKVYNTEHPNEKLTIEAYSFGDYLRKYSNKILINLAGSDGDFPLDDQYFKAMYFYAFGKEYTNGAKHLEFIKPFYGLTVHDRDKGTKHNSAIENVTGAKKIFFAKVLDGLNKNTGIFNKEKQVQQITDFFASRLRIHASEVFRFLSSNPSVLYDHIKSGTKTFLNNKAKSKRIFSKPKKYLICHGLSVHSDSLFLLCDLGRFLRLKNTYNKDAVIMLTRTDFANLNWKVQSLKNEFNNLSDKKILNNLELCLKFRVELYKKLGFNETDQTVVMCGTDDAHSELFDDVVQFKGKKKRKKLDSEKLNQMSMEYNKLVKFIVGKTPDIDLTVHENRMLVIDQIEKFIESDAGHEILGLDFVKLDVAKHLDIIIQVIKTYKSYKVNTFNYFYLQYLHQYRFPFHLKIAVRREKDFDASFSILQTLDNIPEDKFMLYGAYYKDYGVLINTEKGTEKMSVIPYYFPSGSLDKATKSLAEAQETTILLRDSRAEEKIYKIISQYGDSNELCNIMSDLLSIIHYLFFNNEVDKKSKESKKIYVILQDLGSEFITSWKTYTSNDINFVNETRAAFESHLFTHWATETIAPYWYYPFFFSLEENRDSRLKTSNIYARLILAVLQGLESKLGFKKGDLEHWSIID